MGKSLGNYAVPEHAALVRARARNGSARRSHRAAAGEAKIAATQAAPLTKEEALAAAEAEGLTLVPNHKSMTGYKFVTLYSRDAAIEDPTKQRYVIDTIVRRVGGRSAQKKIKRVCATPASAETKSRARLGAEDSKEEAAKMALPDEAPGMTAEEALAAAEAQGLTMVPGLASPDGLGDVHRKRFSQARRRASRSAARDEPECRASRARHARGARRSCRARPRPRRRRFACARARGDDRTRILDA